MSAEGEHAPVVHGERHGGLRRDEGVAEGFVKGFDKRAEVRVVVIEEAMHRLGCGERFGGGRQRRQAVDGSIHAVAMFSHQAPSPQTVKSMQSVAVKPMPR